MSQLVLTCAGRSKINLVCLYPVFLLPTNLKQPMHSPSALTEHVSLNLARFFRSTLYLWYVPVFIAYSNLCIKVGFDVMRFRCDDKRGSGLFEACHRMLRFGGCRPHLPPPLLPSEIQIGKSRLTNITWVDVQRWRR